MSVSVLGLRLVTRFLLDFEDGTTSFDTGVNFKPPDDALLAEVAGEDVFSVATYVQTSS